jgi:outer membrane protein assembly factor BamB
MNARILRVLGACLLCGATAIHYAAPSAGAQSSPAPGGAVQVKASPTEPSTVEKSVHTELVPDLWSRKRGSDWPSFLGPNGDGRSAETGIVVPWPKEGPKILWQIKLGTSYGIGSISKGRLFQFDRFGDKGRVYALNAETGKELWRYEYPTEYDDLYGYNDGPRCSPIVDGNRVYAYGVDGILLCLNALDGALLWKVDTEKDFGVIQNFFGVGSTPVVYGDQLLAMVGGSPAAAQKLPPGLLDRVTGNGSGIVAFDKRTGKVSYKLTDELASYASLKTATIGARPWCFAFCRGGLVGFDPRDGKLGFEFPWRAKSLESVNASMPIVSGNQVLISETYGPGAAMLAVDKDKPKVIWQDDPRKRDKAMQAHWNTPVYHDGYLYGCSGRHTENAELRCIEWKTGKVMWSKDGLTRTSLTYVDGHLISLGEYGSLQLLKATPEKYELVSEVTLTDPLAGPLAEGDSSRRPLLKYPCWAAPVVSHGLLYVRGDDRLVCLELAPD